MTGPPTVTPFLWFDSQARKAAEFYVTLLPDSRITDVEIVNDQVFIVSFTLGGHPYNAMNAGDPYKLTPAFSIAVLCDGQAEVDRLWSALAEGGEELRCGWLTDRFGVSWQVVPQQYHELCHAGTPAQAKAVVAAMMNMLKFDVAALEAAFHAAEETVQ